MEGTQHARAVALDAVLARLPPEDQLQHVAPLLAQHLDIAEPPAAATHRQQLEHTLHTLEALLLLKKLCPEVAIPHAAAVAAALDLTAAGRIGTAFSSKAAAGVVGRFPIALQKEHVGRIFPQLELEPEQQVMGLRMLQQFHPEVLVQHLSAIMPRLEDVENWNSVREFQLIFEAGIWVGALRVTLFQRTGIPVNETVSTHGPG